MPLCLAIIHQRFVMSSLRDIYPLGFVLKVFSEGWRLLFFWSTKPVFHVNACSHFPLQVLAALALAVGFKLQPGLSFPCSDKMMVCLSLHQP
jgi:hypothetical protein